MSAAAHAAKHNGTITLCVMLATIMQALDTTIANVALPHMQSSFSASPSQINLVLTSYIVAAATMMPLTGWLAARFGRKNLFLVTVGGFTVASMLCGAAASLEQMVLFRLLQGICGAPLVPLSQAVLFDTYPREKHGSAMALWGMGVMVGPILGPTLGGWLTEAHGWRWVFYINLPVGVLAFVGLSAFLERNRSQRGLYFDWFGFLGLTMAIGTFQLMLDRGEQLQWFASTEIVIEAALAGLGFYLFLVHTFTTPRPFLDTSLFRDRNFTIGMIFIFLVGSILLATLALLAPFLQTLLDYPVVTAGMLLAPRGIGTMIAMMLVGRLIRRIDPRWMVTAGLLLTALALWQMSRFNLEVTAHIIVRTGILQGFGLGFIFVPLSTMSFSTLPAAQRTSATSLFSLSRNLGSSIGISVMIYLLGERAQVAHASLATAINPFRAPMQHVPALLDPSQPGGRALLDMLVTREAALFAYLDDFRLMMSVALAALFLVPLLRRPDHRPSVAEAEMAETAAVE